MKVVKPTHLKTGDIVLFSGKCRINNSYQPKGFSENPDIELLHGFLGPEIKVKF